MTDIEVIESDLRAARAEQDRQYWLFTRTARGKPVDPAVTRRVCELEHRLRAARRAEREAGESC